MSAAGLPDSWESHRLWSLWEMLKLKADDFMAMTGNLKALQGFLQIGPEGDRLGDGEKSSLARYSTQIGERCEALGLPVSAKMVGYMALPPTRSGARSAIEATERTIHAELAGRTFFEPEGKYKVYFENPKLFGDVVFMAFSSATNDISEAGTCLALERATACVMHLMRVVEAGLAALAKSLGVTRQNDWGGYLRKIDEELSKRYNASGARSPLEQFYAEVAITIDQIRRAWRNPTMHVENSYALDRAEEILGAVRSFMIHLAKEISE